MNASFGTTWISLYRELGNCMIKILTVHPYREKQDAQDRQSRQDGQDKKDKNDEILRILPDSPAKRSLFFFSIPDDVVRRTHYETWGISAVNSRSINLP